MAGTTQKHRLKEEIEAPDPEEFKPWLTGFDLVRGVEYTFDFTVTNAGNDLFPGAQIQFLRFIEYGTSIGRAGLEYRFESFLSPIPKLQPTQSKSLGKFKYTPAMEGILIVDGSATSIDNKPIEWDRGDGNFYPTIGGSYYIIDWNKLRMLNMLDKLTKLKE